MFYSIKELVEQANSRFDGHIAELMIATEMELSGRSRDDDTQPRSHETICHRRLNAKQIHQRINWGRCRQNGRLSQIW